MFFLSSNISVFLRKPTFSISGPDINLARLNWAENRPFSLDSHFAFIERRKVVIQLIYCITFPCPKKHSCWKNWIHLILYWGTKAEASPTLSSSVGEKNGHFEHVLFLGIPNYLRFIGGMTFLKDKIMTSEN